MTIANPEKYITLYKPTHPNSNSQGRIREHVYKASIALGKQIPKGVHIHHVDNNPKNNLNVNLVICSSAYHKLIHARTKALELTGDANKMKCAYCGEYDLPINMFVRKNQYQAWHRECVNKTRRTKNPKTGPYKYASSP